MHLREFLLQAVRISAALWRLHESGSLHLSIRPENIVVTPGVDAVTFRDGATSARGDLSTLDETKRNPASLPYIAPEQTGRVDRPIDERADLYSLGVTLYEMLSGKRPLEANDAPGWVHAHIARAPVPLSETAPDVPGVIGDILAKLLTKAPEERYQSALGLHSDLRACLSELEEFGTIGAFPLGSADIPDKLQIPTKIYGRKRERTVLLDAFERVVKSGTAELVLVAGYSGIGKTSLVREVQVPIVREHGAFISGKFEQLQRDIPYRTIALAFGELVRQLLTESPESLTMWKRRLRDALGPNGQLITEIIPQLTLILGEQPPASELPPAEARHRFVRAFHAFLGAVARKKHPLVLFVDDLQWADLASLRLLRDMIAVSEKRHLLVIGAYRDNEVGPSHPLMDALREIRAAGAPVSSLSLGPLPQENVHELVMDTFRCDGAHAAALAALLIQKTDGNPFFVVQFLMELYRQRLVRIDSVNAAWRWDIKEIAAQNFTDNVVDLVLGRLRRLGPEARKVLTYAACLGSRVEAEVLAAMYGKSVEETHEDMSPAIREGLVATRGRSYKFLHDRVQQAAYLLIPEHERAEMHLSVGRQLLAETPEGALDKRLFMITNQLDIGSSLITDPDERRAVAELNRRAGRKAKASGAYRSAVSYFDAGASLVGEDGWTGDDTLAFGLHHDLAESACLDGDFDRADGLCANLLARATTALDKTSVYRVQMQTYMSRSEHERCVGVGLTCLSLLGIELPRHPTDEEVNAELTTLLGEIRQHTSEEILARPRMSDPLMVAAMGVIAVMYASSAYADPTLNDLLVCQMVRLSLLHGNAESSGIGFASLGKALCLRLGEYRDGDRMGTLGYDLTEALRATSYKAQIANMLATIISVWTRHFDAYVKYSHIGIQAANEIGDTTWGSFNYVQLALSLLLRGDSLEEVQNVTVSALDYTTKAKLGFASDVVVSVQRLVQALRGSTPHVGCLSGDDFEEEAFEAHLEKESFPTIRLIYYNMKLMSRVLAGSHDEAVLAAAAAERNLAGGIGMVATAEYHYYAALARAAHFPQAPEEAQDARRRELAAHEEQLRVWSESCPENFAGRHALVAAEIARLAGRHDDAAALYDRAIISFRGSGFIHQEAIANELAGRFYLDRGYAGLPGLYLREAVAAYSRWGASGKVRQLEQHHALILDQEQRRSTSSGVMRMVAEAADAQTAVKVSRTLSGEMTPKEMMESLMRLVVEHEGAERCCLLLTGDGLRVAAEAAVGREGIDIQVFEQSTAPPATRVPQSIINYVQRTLERVVLSNVAGNTTFAADEYLLRERPKSLLCLPLMKSPGEVGGLLYLENRLVHGAFVLRRLSLLEYLAALSLQNMLLRGELSRERARCERSEASLRRSEQALKDLAEGMDAH